MGMLSSFLHPGRAYRKAEQGMMPFYNQAQSYAQPYAQQGQAAYQPLNSAMQSLLNPRQLQGDWMAGYEESPYATQLSDMATNQGLEAASSMGLMGSTPALRAIQEGTSFIKNQDRQRYLDDLFQKYITGANIAQNIYGQGAQMSSLLGNNAMNMGQNVAQLRYGRQAAPGNLFGNLLGTLLGGGLMSGSAGNQMQPWMMGG